MREKSSGLRKLLADLQQQNGHQAEISGSEASTCVLHLVGEATRARTVGNSRRILPWLLAGSVRWEERGSEGADGAEGRGGRRWCTAAGRWVRSVSTVRELDRASGPLIVGPMPTRLCAYTDSQRHKYARERAAASCIRAQRHHTSLASNALCECASERARARARTLRECAWASDTLPVSQCVRQERCIALRRCVKASENTRSLSLFARLVPSFSRRRAASRRALFGALSPRPSSPFAMARVPFSPFQSLRRKVPSLAPPYPVPPAGDPALRLHRRYCEREDFDEERMYRESL